MSDTAIDDVCHFVWATKKREALIGPDMEPKLYDFIRRKCEDMSVHVYALNGMPDHVHLVCTPPKTASIPEFIQAIKGGSAYFINRVAQIPPSLYWQPGYGMLTFTQDEMARVVAYVDNQKTHHEQGSLWPKLERTETPKP